MIVVLILRPAWFHVEERAHIDFGVLADSVYLFSFIAGSFSTSSYAGRRSVHWWWIRDISWLYLYWQYCSKWWCGHHHVYLLLCLGLFLTWMWIFENCWLDFMFSFILIVLVYHWCTLLGLCRSQLFLGDMQSVSLCVLVFDCCVWLLHDRGVDPLCWLRPAWFHVEERAHMDFGVLADSVYFCFWSFSLCWCIIDAHYLICVGRNFFSGTCRA